MQANSISVSYELSFAAPFHFGTGMRAGLIHCAAARDAQGYLYVPGSTLKGVLRDRATQLAGLFDIPALEPHNTAGDLAEFGPQPDASALIFGSRYRPGTLYFDDACMVGEDRCFYDGPQETTGCIHTQVELADRPCASDSPNGQETRRYIHKQVETRTQVSLSRLSGTARRGFLHSKEYGQRELRFAGKIYGSLEGVPLPNRPDETYSLLLLLISLLSLDRLGAGQTSGAGRVNCTIANLQVDSIPVKLEDCLSAIGDLEVFKLAQEEG